VQIKRAVMHAECEFCNRNYTNCNLILFEDGSKKFACRRCTYCLENAETYTVRGFEILKYKTVSPGSQSAGKVYVPKEWIGKRVTVVRFDP
jgi:putative transposon-encoded protein